MKVNYTFFKYFAYTLEILILYVIQGTPNFVPELFGSKPLFLIPAAISIASVENKIPSLVFGAVCGLLLDIGTGGSIGFFAILLTVICYAEAHIFKKYLVPSFVSVFIISAIVIPCIICLYFFVFYILTGTAECGYIFVNHYIARIIYTLAMIAPFYLLNSFISRKSD